MKAQHRSAPLELRIPVPWSNRVHFPGGRESFERFKLLGQRTFSVSQGPSWRLRVPFLSDWLKGSWVRHESLVCLLDMVLQGEVLMEIGKSVV